MKIKKKWIALSCILLAFCFLFVGVANCVQESISAMSISARGCAVIETSTKRKLFTMNENKKMPMASTTKIMTAITAIENCKDLDEKFEISPKAVGVPGTSLYLRKGDVYSTRDLLYALMLISGNDASVAIAEHVAGSTSEFVTMMNDLCRKIGAENTHFANTHGLDADGHYTTAYDLACITAYALENETFSEIVSTKNIKITNGEGENRYLKNKNKLLSTLEGCIGVKTGFTDDAGRCLVSAIEKDGMKLVCVVLNCGPMFQESALLLQECAKAYKLYDLTELYDYDKTISVEDGRTDSAEIGTMGHFVYPLTESELARVNVVYTCPKSVEAPLSKGSEVGKVEIFLNNDLLFSEKIYTIEEIKTKSIIQRMQDFFKNW
ncbi:MAG: D-alanyl-D-alanine carboxypeptidase [Clostridia bacterium]|nr:D-alanyl-D-alanine carboxypeptidase [Clostridia bacterium]